MLSIIKVRFAFTKQNFVKKDFVPGVKSI
jgi:hypothetical protein